MFKKLRLRFLLIAAGAILLILASTLGIINSARYFQTQQQITRVLTVLSANNGRFPSLEETSKDLGNKLSSDDLRRFRYYSATVDAQTKNIQLNTENVANITDKEAIVRIRKIVKSGKKQGTFSEGRSQYSYLVTKNKAGNKVIVVLDVTAYQQSFQDLLSISVMLAILGFIFFMAIVVGLSSLMIKPFVENYEKQRRFITNAGHELKTPLAIIAANNELIEMVAGESEWTKSTDDQVKRLTKLIDRLVSLARLEEQPDMVLKEVDFSAITQDAAADFKSVIVKDDKTLELDIQPDISVKAEEKALFEMVSILTDNANKYCDQNGTVKVQLDTVGHTRKRGRLQISNTYAAGEDVDYSRFFERFYREDESHNSQKKGYGIGLSMAQSIVKAFKGQINISYKNKVITFTVII